MIKSTYTSWAKMADCSVKAVKMARILAIAYIIVGFLLFCFGIADRLVETDIWTDDAYFGIWIGIWVSSTVFTFVARLKRNY